VDTCLLDTDVLESTVDTLVDVVTLEDSITTVPFLISTILDILERSVCVNSTL